MMLSSSLVKRGLVPLAFAPAGKVLQHFQPLVFDITLKAEVLMHFLGAEGQEGIKHLLKLGDDA